VSFGMSAHPEDDGTVKRMVKVADDRLLLSKKNLLGDLTLAPEAWTINSRKS